MDDLRYPEADPNKKPANEVWNARYDRADYVFGKEPCSLLREQVSVLRKGRALDVAMGEGRNTVFLAQQGFTAEGLDCSSKAIEKAQKLAADLGVSIEAKSQNLDFFLMPLMKYDTVVLSYYKPQGRFFSEIRRGLVAGGTVLVEAPLFEAMKTNSDLTREECYQPNELLPLLKDFRVLYYDELGLSVRAIARKMQN